MKGWYVATTQGTWCKISGFGWRHYCVLCGKANDVFETNPLIAIFCFCPEMKIYGKLDKHPGFQQRYKMIHK